MSYPIRAGSAMWEVQTGVYSVLSRDPELQQRSKGIFDGTIPPEVPIAFPYILIGEATEAGADRLTTVARSVTQTIHVYSNYQGMKEGKFIVERIAELLDRRSILMTGWNSVSIRIELNEAFTEADDVRHLVLRFRFEVQPKI